MNKTLYGTLEDGTPVYEYSVSNGSMSFSAINLGCRITSILIPSNADGSSVDVTLGCSSLESYVSDFCSFGAVVGRYANRIGGAGFFLDGHTYKLDENYGPHTLHGGFDRFEGKVWSGEFLEGEEKGVRFTRLSPHGEQKFPGNCQITVEYVLTDQNEIVLRFYAVTDRKTVINLTNHTYFNLKGTGNGSVLDHELFINASSYVETDSMLVPTGNLKKVNKVLDFTNKKSIGSDIMDITTYDHCYCIKTAADDQLKLCAQVYSPSNGVKLTVLSTQCGVQFYSADIVEGVKGKNGVVYRKYDGFCLESQAFPDSPNHSNFPSTVLCPGQVYSQTTVWKFEFLTNAGN